MTTKQKLAAVRPCSYAQTTRLVHGEPHLPAGTRVWVRQRQGTRRSGIRFEVMFDREQEDRSEVQCLYWVDEDALMTCEENLK